MPSNDVAGLTVAAWRYRNEKEALMDKIKHKQYDAMGR
jgi:hypothetical protein